MVAPKPRHLGDATANCRCGHPHSMGWALDKHFETSRCQWTPASHASPLPTLPDLGRGKLTGCRHPKGIRRDGGIRRGRVPVLWGFHQIGSMAAAPKKWEYPSRLRGGQEVLGARCIPRRLACHVIQARR